MIPLSQQNVYRTRMFVNVMLWMLFGMCVITGVQAQDEIIIYDNIIIIHQVRVWRFDTITQEFEPVGDPIPQLRALATSPTGTHFIFKADPEVFLDDIAAECPCGGGELPSDVTLINVMDATRKTIAGQPEGATLSEGIARSGFVWSPDGLKVAWTEGVEYGTLVIYDLATDSATSVARDIPSQTQVSSPTQLASWTNTGILVEIVDFMSQQVGFRIYAPDGQIVFDLSPRFVNPDSFRMVLDGPVERLAVSEKGVWHFFDVTTGNELPITTGRFAEISPPAQEVSYRISAPTLQQPYPKRLYDIFEPDVSLAANLETHEPIRVLPSGRGIMIPFYNVLTIWRSPTDQYSIQLPLPSGPMAIMYPQTLATLLPATSPLVTNGTCAGNTHDFRLAAYGNGFVIGNAPNNVRAEPTVNGQLLGTIGGGDWFDIYGGPECTDDGIAWWFVQLGDLKGWTAESTREEYFIQPGCPETGCIRN